MSQTPPEPVVEYDRGNVIVTPELEVALEEIVEHWDAKDGLCITCEAVWNKLTWAFRDEFRHNYELEREE